MNILKFKFRTLLTLLFVSVGMFVPNSAWAEFDENGFGTGSDEGRYQEAPLAEGFYQISNAGQLYWFAQKVNSGSSSIYGKLMCDITVNKDVLAAVESGNTDGLRQWEPIGNKSCHFKGSFDGNNFNINGLYNKTTISSDYHGLFGYIENSNTELTNINIKDSYFEGIKNIGGICGYSSSSGFTISNCSFNGSIKATSNYIGGILGQGYANISNCTSTCNISNNYGNYIGGICGFLNNGGSILKCHSNGIITNGYYIGGICGYTYSSPISECYYTGSISSTQTYVAGICGYSSSSSISKCYFIGSVNASGYVGGICGSCYSSISNCYVQGKISSSNGKCGNISGYCSSQISNCYTATEKTNAAPICNESHNSNCYYINNLPTGSGGRTEKQFASGMVCNELNAGGTLWRQSKGEKYPSFEGELPTYTACENHNFVNGICSICEALEEPKLVDGYYQIKYASHLSWFANYVNSGHFNANAMLMNSITLNEDVLEKVSAGTTDDLHEWEPIGESSSNPFKGTFNGQGYTVSGLYINNPSISYIGFIGYLYNSDNTKVINLNLRDSYINAYQYVGGFCGYNYYALVKGCTFEGKIESVYGYAGGISGYMSEGTIEACCNKGNVISNSGNIGGICGGYGTIKQCCNMGTISGKGSVGGIIGTNGIVENCYNVGNVSSTGYSTFGGISSDSYTKVKNCFSYIEAVNNSYYYPIAPFSNNVINSYYLSDKENTKGGKTAKQFARGTVCYLLNSNNENPVWRQIVGTDNFPTYLGNEVLAEDIKCNHEYDDNGFCSKCDAMRMPTFDNDGVVLIADVYDLYWFANYVNNDGFTDANARLVNNIVVNESLLNKVHEENTADLRPWIPIIGNSSRMYSGNFDGNNKTISGIYVNSNSDFVGLFGKSGSISNLRVEDSYIKGAINVGGICGYLNGKQVANCSFNGEVYGKSYVGGIIGYPNPNFSPVITKCYNEGSVTLMATNTTNRYVGGICGSRPKTISDCYNTGSIKNTYNNGYVAGICGDGASCTIVNCYNTGALSNNTAYPISNCKYRGCYFLSENETSEGGKTAVQFANGAVCVLLNSGRTNEDAVWRQVIGTDAAPSFAGDVVEKSSCEHQFDENGVCTICGAKETLAKLENGYYLISNLEELYWFAEEFKASSAITNGRLTNDITINAENATELNVWSPIGTTDKPFDGIFDGDGHSIIGLKFTDNTKSYIGLFGVAIGGTIKNLKLVNADIVGKDFVGGICATTTNNSSSVNTSIINCEFDGSITANNHVGGMCGDGTYVMIKQCANKGTINGNSYLGGLSGVYGTVYNSYNWGTISRSNYNGYSGSLIGYSGSIYNCYSVGIPTNFSNYFSGKNNYYLSSTESESGQTQLQFKKGEVCLKLNTGNSNPVWCQTIGTDLYPVFVGKNILTEEDLQCKHTFENGICTKCELFEQATKNEDYYEIANAGQLYWYLTNLSVEKTNGRLIDDITVNASFEGDKLNKWTSYPITDITFDGQDHTISGLYVDDQWGEEVGLFSIANNATIKNVKVRNSYFKGNIRMGGICGSASASTITNCSFDGKIEGKATIGGICGVQSNGTVISKCYNLGTLYASSDYIGGICGYVPISSGNVVINCYHAGEIKVANNKVHSGAVCGASNCNDFKMENCANVGIIPRGIWSYIWCSNSGFSYNCWDLYNHETMFKSGEVCWKLNKNKTNGVWHQTLGTDMYPTFEGGLVKQVVTGDEITYINKFSPTKDADDFYQLADADDLLWFADEVNAGNTTINARLLADITLNKNVVAGVKAGETDGLIIWSPIANFENPYAGIFDGAGYKISGLYYETDQNYVGLFSVISSAEIKDLSIDDSYFNAYQYVGSICGKVVNSKINKCANLNTYLTARDYLGGICGEAETSVFDNCYSKGNVVDHSSYAYLGGIVGYIEETTISNSYNANYTKYSGYSNPIAYEYHGGTNCYYLSDKETEDGGRTANQFKYGKVCWELNGQNTDENVVWRQIVGTDALPSFVGDIVDYKPCTEHHFVDGICKVCGEEKAPELKDGYYLLTNAAELTWFAKQVNIGFTEINARLVNDIVINDTIDLTNENMVLWNPIAMSAIYQGNFDGANHTISGLVCYQPEGYAGLFGVCGESANITGVNIRNSYLKGMMCGGISGISQGHISMCSFNGESMGDLYTGGIAAFSSGEILNCYNLSSSKEGICRNYGGTVKNCFNYNKNVTVSFDGEKGFENSYYLSDEETEDGGRTAKQFEIGMVCWELNGRKADENVVWRQVVGTDALPSFVGDIVEYKPCTEHHYVDGICEVCDAVKVPDLVDGTYLLSNAKELFWFAKNVNAGHVDIDARIVADITLNENVVEKVEAGEFEELEPWIPIGSGQYPYTGVFDGGNFVISGLYAENSSYGGLFGFVNNATIKSVNVRDSKFINCSYTGGICGFANSNFSDGYSTIMHCSFDGAIESSFPSGGIVGYSYAIIEDCFNLGTVSSYAPIGGICGVMNGDPSIVKIKNCYNYADVAYPICGSSSGSISNCYYLSDEETEDGGRTAAQFADGTVTALLNNGRTGDDIVWFQNGDKPGFEQAEAPAKKLLLNDNSFAFVEGMEYDTVTYTRTGIESNWASLCLPFAFTTDDCKEGGITLFAVNGINDGAIILEQVTSVSAGEPVLFYSSTKADLKIVVTGNIQLTNSPNEELDLKGSFVEQTIYTTDFPDREIYYLKNNQYLKGNGNFKLKPFHAFLAGEADVNVKSLRIAMPNEVVDESVVEDETFNMVNPSIFNVSGQRVSNMRNGGVYIIKKMDGTVQKVHIVE